MKFGCGHMMAGGMLLGFCVIVGTTFADPATVEPGKAMPGEVLVKFKVGVGSAEIDRINRQHGAQVLYRSPYGGFSRLRTPPGRSVEEVVSVYSQIPAVEYAEPNLVCEAHLVPNDPYYGYQWHLNNAVYGGIRMQAAWDLNPGGRPSVVVAIVDTGVAYEDYTRTYKRAPDLAQTNFVPGWDFINNDAHPNDDEGHGTHVTGTVAQSTNNSLGVAGVAFNTSIMPVKVLDSQGYGTTQTVADGIYFATDNGAHVINMSLGWPPGVDPGTTLRNAVAYAYGQGVTIVCSSGNSGDEPGYSGQVSYPAAYDQYCIAVGASRYDEAVSYYSSWGSSLDLTAPGGDLNVDQNGDGYGDGVLQQTFGSTPRTFAYYFYQGTSMAAPHVSGVAALLIASGVAGPDAVRQVLQSTAEDHGAAGLDPYYGWGIVDARAALETTVGPNNPPVANAGGPYAGTEGAAVQFDGTASYDPDGNPITYTWDFGDGTTGTGATPTHVYTTGLPGVVTNYTVTLTVTDSRGASSAAQTTAQITGVNDSPVANAGPDKTGKVGQMLTFDGSGSYDEEDGTNLSYAWNFGDGAMASGVTVQHAYSAVGTYTVTLTVTDNAGASASDSAIVKIKPGRG